MMEGGATWLEAVRRRAQTCSCLKFKAFWFRGPQAQGLQASGAQHDRSHKANSHAFVAFAFFTFLELSFAFFCFLYVLMSQCLTRVRTRVCLFALQSAAGLCKCVVTVNV